MQANKKAYLHTNTHIKTHTHTHIHIHICLNSIIVRPKFNIYKLIKFNIYIIYKIYVP